VVEVGAERLSGDDDEDGVDATTVFRDEAVAVVEAITGA
jgi:hypothetical protein